MADEQLFFRINEGTLPLDLQGVWEDRRIMSITCIIEMVERFTRDEAEYNDDGTKIAQAYASFAPPPLNAPPNAAHK